MPYLYGSFKTLAKAESYLESMFNRGDVSESERPAIKHSHGAWRLYLHDFSAPPSCWGKP